MTGNDLIASALRLIGVLASGETPSASEANDALMIANQMLDSWTAERLMIFGGSMQEFSLTPTKQTYTLGTGGDFNMPRPARIERMGIVSLNNPAQPLELPLEMLTDEQWEDIPVKLIPSSLPQEVYDDGAFPLRNLSFWSIPSVACNIRIYSWSALTQFDLFTDITFPPGYMKAIRYNLAVDLCPEFGRSVSPEVAMQAVSSKAIIKSINIPLLDLRCDAAVAGDGGGFNWLTGE